MICYVYILECSDGSYYTGWTNDLDNRVKMHNLGKGSKYVKGKRPAKLVYYHTYNDKRKAMSVEWKIKHQYSRQDKIDLINSENNELTRRSDNGQ